MDFVFGALATVAGILVTAVIQHFVRRSARQREQKAAARAWRDDFYYMQTRIAEATHAGVDLVVNTARDEQLGTNTSFMVIAEALAGQNEWSEVAAARRSMIDLIARCTAGQPPNEAEALSLFWRFQVAREALVKVDPNWPAGAHRRQDWMGSKPEHIEPFMLTQPPA